MSKKLKIIIGIIAIVILILIVRNIVKSNSNEEISETETTLSDIKYDEETAEYYIEDEETGEILHTASSEDELRIYTIDPDYDPENPDAPTDDEFYEEFEEDIIE